MNEFGNEIARSYVVNSETGEITDELFAGDRIIRARQNEYIQNNYINFQKGKGFTKTFDSVVIPLYAKLTAKEFSIAMALTPFISYGDGILRYNGKYATSKDIAKILGESYSVIKKNVSALIVYDVIKKIEQPSELRKDRNRSCLIANPYIFMRGQDIKNESITLFSASYWASL